MEVRFPVEPFQDSSMIFSCKQVWLFWVVGVVVKRNYRYYYILTGDE